MVVGLEDLAIRGLRVNSGVGSQFATVQESTH